MWLSRSFGTLSIFISYSYPCLVIWLTGRVGW
jgi:hypothetical protein